MAAGQALTELSLLLVGNNDPQPGFLNAVLIHLGRIEKTEWDYIDSKETLAKSVQALIHLLALGGYCIPIQKCCKSGLPLDPPIGNWEWRCSLIPQEGFAIGEIANTRIQLNPSELALLQRLLQPKLPLRKDGEIMGPKKVWLNLLEVIECWIENHLPRNLHSLKMLKELSINSKIKSNITIN